MQIVESVKSTPDLEAREERRCSGRRAVGGHGLDMEDLASMCERQCRKACSLRSAAEELEGTGSNSRAWRYRKRGSPKPAAEARAMEMDPSPVRLWSAADSEGHSDGYRTAFPSESEEMARPPPRAHTAPGHGRGHPGGNLWVKDPTTGIWTAGGASPSRIPNPMSSGPTGPHSMEERDVRGVYSHPPATGGIRLGGVVAADVGDAIRIDNLRGIKIPYYDGNPSKPG